MPDRPPTEPTFTDTMQIGIVVPDLDAAVRTYRDVYGIGPWEIFEIGPENSQDVRLYGQPVEWRGRAAITMVGHVMWELIQPLDDNGLFARFLAERGGGVCPRSRRRSARGYRRRSADSALGASECW